MDKEGSMQSTQMVWRTYLVLLYLFIPQCIDILLPKLFFGVSNVTPTTDYTIRIS